jgi:phosphohistidine phosphatase
MKTLTLLRHVKTNKAENGQADFDRGLHEKGKQQIDILKRYFEISLGSTPVDVHCSSSKRTRSTLNGIASALTIAQKEFEKKLYLADVSTLLVYINKITSPNDHLLIIGHNEGLSDLASYLGNDRIHLSTGALISFEFDAAIWGEVSIANGRLSGHFSPQGDF